MAFYLLPVEPVAKVGIIEAAAGLAMIGHGAKGTRAATATVDAVKTGVRTAHGVLQPTVATAGGRLGMTGISRRRAAYIGGGTLLVANAHGRRSDSQYRRKSRKGAFAGGAAVGGGAVMIAHGRGSRD